MRTIKWRRALAMTAVCSTLALSACTTDPVMESMTKDPRLSPQEQTIATAQRFMRLGDAAMAAGDARTAVGFYSRAVRLESDDYPMLIQLGDALNDLGAYAFAAEAYQKVLEFAPRDPEALRGLGNAMLAQNRPLLAREKYETALEVSADPRLLGAIGITLDMTGDHKAAQSYYRKGLEQAPGNLTLNNNLALSLTLDGQHGEAIDILKQVATDPNANLRHRQNLALVFGLAGRTKDARMVSEMDFDPQTVAENLAYYEVLRDLPDKAKYLLGPNRQRFAVTKEPQTPVPPARASAKAADTPAETATAIPDAAVVNSPLPAPEINRADFNAAATPAALPPVGPQQLDVPVRAWDVPEDVTETAPIVRRPATADIVPTAPAELPPAYYLAPDPVHSIAPSEVPPAAAPAAAQDGEPVPDDNAPATVASTMTIT
ncbi:MAG: tetratricopeptide repeat protein [Alphaproteobacteria bacterium]|nr:tetratricopeptide repeat protein [Alphaproteobacteria bacterium]